MATLLEDLSDIEEKAQGLVENKVANFAYTQEAYDNDDVDGVSEYDVNSAQNIPTADAETLDVNTTVLNKGYRSQASSITRMLMNHFLGRTSYNLNKSVDLFKKGFLGIKNAIGNPNGIATLDENGYLNKEQTLIPYYKPPLIRDIYHEGKLCYNSEKSSTDNIGECWKVYNDKNITVFAMGCTVYKYDIRTDEVSTIVLSANIVGAHTNTNTNTFIVVTLNEIVFLNSDFSGIERTILVNNSSTITKYCYLCLNGYIFIRTASTMYAYKIEEYINDQISFSLSTTITNVNKIVCSSLMCVIETTDSSDVTTVSYFTFKNKELVLKTVTNATIFNFTYSISINTTGAKTPYSCAVVTSGAAAIIPTFKYVRTITNKNNPTYTPAQDATTINYNRTDFVPINEKYFLKRFIYNGYYKNGIAFGITSDPNTMGGDFIGVNAPTIEFATKNMAGYGVGQTSSNSAPAKIVDLDGVILDGANIDAMLFAPSFVNVVSAIEVVSTPYVNILITAKREPSNTSASYTTKIYTQKTNS